MQKTVLDALLSEDIHKEFAGWKPLKILYQDMLGFVKDYVANRLSYELDYPFVKPWRVNFDITHKCPLRCVMCDIWKQKNNSKELTFKELKKLLDEIKGWGIDHVSFAGGETLVRKNNVIELIKHASRKGMRTDLITNGYFLNKTICRKLLMAGVSKISLSVDGAKRLSHERIRGKESFDKVIKAARCLEEMRRRLKVRTELEFTTVVLNYNFRELVDIFYLMRSLNFDYINYQVVVPDNGFTLDVESFHEFYRGKFWLKEKEIKQLEKIVETLVNIKKKTGQIRNTRAYLKLMPQYFRLKDKFNTGKCIVGYSYLNIDPYGNVSVCGLGPNVNVKNNGLEGLWKSKEYRKTRQMIKECRRPCLMLCYDKLEFKPLLEAWLELRGWLK